jgi:dienelactone hydrolase
MKDIPELNNLHFHTLEQVDVKPLVSPLAMDAIENSRKEVYQSYESFLRNELVRLDNERDFQWSRNYSSLEIYVKSISEMRKNLKKMLGFWIAPEQRSPIRCFDKLIILEEKDFIAYRFFFEVIKGLENYAVELVPKCEGKHPGLLIQHGYGGTPELVCGLTSGANQEDYSYRSLGIRAVRRGFHVIAVHHPSGYGDLKDVEETLPDFSDYPCYGKNRLHRMAIMQGKTLFGLDMLSSSRSIDFLTQCEDVWQDRIGMYGLSQGGQSALYLPALDERIKASVCSAYFNKRFLKLIGPHRAPCYLDTHEEDKFFADTIKFFSDSDIVSLIAPRAFAVEAGKLDKSVDFEKAFEEYQRAYIHYDKLNIRDKIEFIAHKAGHISATGRAFEFLLRNL